MHEKENMWTEKSVHITLNQRHPFDIMEFPVEFWNSVEKYSVAIEIYPLCLRNS